MKPNVVSKVNELWVSYYEITDDEYRAVFSVAYIYNIYI